MNITDLNQQFIRHRNAYDDAQTEFAATAVMLDRYTRNLFRRYGIKASFSSDIAVHLESKRAYVEVRLEMKRPLYRKQVLEALKEAWELLSEFRYEKGRVFNIHYWGAQFTAETRSEYHYHPEKFPVTMATAKMEIALN